MWPHQQASVDCLAVLDFQIIVLICTAKKNLALLEKARTFNSSTEPLGLIKKINTACLQITSFCSMPFRYNVDEGKN